MAAFKPPGQCPVCGEWVPRGAAACDECGACARSGWRQDAEVYDGLDLPDDDFDYDAFVEQEFGGHGKGGQKAPQLWWWVALVLLAVFVLGYALSAR